MSDMSRRTQSEALAATYFELLEFHAFIPTAFKRLLHTFQSDQAFPSVFWPRGGPWRTCTFRQTMGRESATMLKTDQDVVF